MQQENDNDQRLMFRSPLSTSNVASKVETTTNDLTLTTRTTSHSNGSNADRLVEIHKRIIHDVSSLQRKWVNIRARRTTIDGQQSNEKPQPSFMIQQKKDLLQRLDQLRKHRMVLMTKVSIAKRPKATTLYNQLQKRHQSEQINHNSTSQSNNDKEDHVKQRNTSLMYDHNYQKYVWDQIRLVRQLKCLQAAYRLAGISMNMVTTQSNNNSNADNDVDADTNKGINIKFDVGNHCYECVFDIVRHTDRTTQNTKAHTKVAAFDNYNGNDKRSCEIFLQLTHHTLPSAIPITTILYRASMGTVGNNIISNVTPSSSTLIGINDIQLPLIPIQPITTATTDSNSRAFPFDVQNNIEIQQDSLINQLQSITQQIYHTCHAYHVRKEIFEYLNDLATLSTNGFSHNNNSDDKPFPYSITDLDCTMLPNQHIYKRIQFHIKHNLSSIDQIHVVLNYTSDLCRQKSHQPMLVQVKIISPILHQNMKRFNHTKKIIKSLLSPSSSLLVNHPHYQHNGIVSDVEDDDDDDNNIEDDHCEFIENVTRMFRTLPIEDAIRAVTDAMTEY